MKRIFLIYILSMAGHGDRHLYSDEPDYTISVVSFNLLFQGGDRNLTLKTLKASKAEVLLLQEVSPGWEMQLRKQFKRYGHQYYRSHHGTHGLAVLSKYPLSDITYIHNRANRSIAQCFVIKAQQELFACNLHLASPSYMLNKESLNIREYMKTHQTRTFQWARIHRYIKETAKDRPIILAGDFNTMPIELLYHNITKRFTDVWDRNLAYGATFPNRTSVVPEPVVRIDYIFVRRAIPIEAQLLTESGSDHLGLKARIGYWQRHPVGDIGHKQARLN